MMIVRTILFTLTVLFLQTGYGQGIKLDSIKFDSLQAQKKYLPTGIRIGTDVISLIKSNIRDDFSGWEANADIDFYRYLLAIDYGKWGRTFGGDSSHYENDGKYWRVGVDANFLTRDPDRNVFFLGFRYGRSRYSETLNVIAEDDVWGVVKRNYTNTNLNARWFELTGGLKVKVYKFIWLGYTGRLKFGLKQNKSFEMLSHDVPGYGRTDKDTAWGFNYHIFIRIPFRNTESILPNKKK